MSASKPDGRVSVVDLGREQEMVSCCRWRCCGVRGGRSGGSRRSKDAVRQKKRPDMIRKKLSRWSTILAWKQSDDGMPLFGTGSTFLKELPLFKSFLPPIFIHCLHTTFSITMSTSTILMST